MQSNIVTIAAPGSNIGHTYRNVRWSVGNRSGVASSREQGVMNTWQWWSEAELGELGFDWKVNSKGGDCVRSLESDNRRDPILRVFADGNMELGWADTSMSVPGGWGDVDNMEDVVRLISLLIVAAITRRLTDL